jgi:hypothetical protein
MTTTYRCAIVALMLLSAAGGPLRAQQPRLAAGDTATLQAGHRQATQVVIEAVVGDSADVHLIGRYLNLVPRPAVLLEDVLVAGLHVPRDMVSRVAINPQVRTARVPLAALRPAREPPRRPAASGAAAQTQPRHAGGDGNVVRLHLRDGGHLVATLLTRDSQYTVLPRTLVPLPIVEADLFVALPGDTLGMRLMQARLLAVTFRSDVTLHVPEPLVQGMDVQRGTRRGRNPEAPGIFFIGGPTLAGVLAGTGAVVGAICGCGGGAGRLALIGAGTGFGIALAASLQEYNRQVPVWVPADLD